MAEQHVNEPDEDTELLGSIQNAFELSVLRPTYEAFKHLREATEDARDRLERREKEHREEIAEIQSASSSEIERLKGELARVNLKAEQLASRLAEFQVSLFALYRPDAAR
jgi:hypothetical protein